MALHDRTYLSLTAATAIASLQDCVLVQALPVWIVLRTNAPRWMAAIVLFVGAITVALIQLPATRSIAIRGRLPVCSRCPDRCSWWRGS